MVLDLLEHGTFSVDLLPHVLDDLALAVVLLAERRVLFLQHQVVSVELLDHSAHELEAIGERLDLV